MLTMCLLVFILVVTFKFVLIYLSTVAKMLGLLFLFFFFYKNVFPKQIYQLLIAKRL